MKFELKDKDLKIVDGKFVQLPMARFAALAEYVEDLEGRLLAAEVNLREAARVDQEMEDLTREGTEAQEPLSRADAKQVESVVQRLEPAELEKLRAEKRVPLRRLAMVTGIPYATLYRYMKGQECSARTAKQIWDVLEREPIRIESLLSPRKTKKMFRKYYSAEQKQRR